MKTSYFLSKSWRGMAMAFLLLVCFGQVKADSGVNLYYVPPVGSGLPAVFTDIDPGAPYVLADQTCASTVVTNDPFCLTNAWDQICQDAYDTCLYGCTGPAWYLPDVINGGAAYFGCPQAGFTAAANQQCVADYVLEDPFCLNTNWDSICQEAYDNCVTYGCFFNIGWYIPETVGGGVAYFGCPQTGFVLAANQQCVADYVALDPFCLSNSWDQVCQDAYDNCATYGCFDPLWYLPDALNGGPAYFGCPSAGYSPAASQGCVQAVVDNDPFCLNNNWDVFCQTAYDNCQTYGCVDPAWYIPSSPSGVDPAIFGCNPGGIYVIATYQSCVQSVVDNDPFCLDTGWDSICQDSYVDCFSGCTDFNACNYDPAAFEDDGSCTYPLIYIPAFYDGTPAVFSCSNPGGNYILADQACAQQVIDNDPFCLNTEWDSICQSAYDCCLGVNLGCTDSFACNYDPSATCDDGSCDYTVYWFIPCVPGDGPVVQACSAPTGYVLGHQECVEYVINVDPYCINTEWDSICQGEYEDCVLGGAANGCTYPDATNYDANALVDNGSCTFNGMSSCPADLTGDMVVNTADLIVMLSSFGTTCP